MPTITADSNDGHIYVASTSNWTSARNPSSGTAESGSTNHVSSVRARRIASGRGTQWQVWRAFFEFDTSGISATPSEADLKIYGYGNGSADFFVIKSSHSNPLDNGDFDAIPTT